MAQVEMPNIFGQFLAGKKVGEEERRQRTLSDFLQPALGGDQGALAKVYGADPNAGLQVQGMAQKSQAAGREQDVADLQQAARLYSAAPPEMKDHLYSRIVDLTEKVGIAAPGSLPRQHDPALDANFSKFLAGIAGDDQQRNVAVAPGSAIVDPRTGQVVYERPYAPANMQPIQTDQGYAAFDPRSGTAAPLTYGSAVGEPSGSYQDVFADIAARNGSQVTSGVRPVLPGVGAGANSQHPKGTAADFRTNGLPPQQVQALMQDLQAQGFEVIDERDNRNGRGPHLHAELPPGAQRVMPAQKQAAQSDFERRLGLAQQMGASPDQLKQMVMGETGGGKPSATQIKLANTAKAKLIDLEALERQLATVESAFGRLKGTYSAGLGGGLLQTEDGRRFDAAVSLLKGQVRKLTRTPGEGAMSDYESKLAELANPSRGEYEQVTADQIQQLRELVKTTRQGYEALLQDAGGNSANLPGGQKASDDDEALIGKYL